MRLRKEMENKTKERKKREKMNISQHITGTLKEKALNASQRSRIP